MEKKKIWKQKKNFKIFLFSPKKLDWECFWWKRSSSGWYKNSSTRWWLLFLQRFTILLPVLCCSWLQQLNFGQRKIIELLEMLVRCLTTWRKSRRSHRWRRQRVASHRLLALLAHAAGTKVSLLVLIVTTVPRDLLTPILAEGEGDGWPEYKPQAWTDVCGHGLNWRGD